MSLWSEASGAGPFGPSRRGPAHLEAAERLKEWTRARFALGEDDTILVAEAAPALPGFPPLETVVAFWSGGMRHHYRVFKPVEDVAAEDLPPAWLKASLALSEGIECACC